MKSIQLLSLTSKGDEAIRLYVEEVNALVKRHPIKVKIAERLKIKLGTTEEVLYNPSRIIVTINKEVNLYEHLTQVKLKLEKLMRKYDVSTEDYTIEVL